MRNGLIVKLVAIALMTAAATADLAGAPAPVTQAAPAPVAAAAAAADEFATFGVAVQAPPGWQRLWEGRANMIARWSDAAPGARAPARHRATAVMTLELEPANGRTLAQYVAARQEQVRDAQIGIHALVMGGQPAMRITGKDASGNAAVDVLLTLNDRHFYALTGYAAVPRLLPTAAMDEIARTMKFVEIADPAQAIAPREPVTFLDRFRIAPLRTMRPSSEPAPARSVSLLVHDYRTSPARAALSLDAQVIHNPNRLPLLDIADQIARHVAPDAGVEWVEMPATATSPRVMSRPFTFTHTDGSKVDARLALVRLSETEALYLNFAIGSPSAASRAAMESAAEAIVASITPVSR